MNKKIMCVLVVLMMTALLAVGVFAADPAVVYVQYGATGTGASAEDPIGSFDGAIAALDGNGGTIYLCGAVPYYQDLKIPEQANDLTITAAEGTNGKLVFTDTLTLEKNNNANTVKFDMPLVTDADGATIFGAFNSVHFGTNFSVDGVLDFYGGVAAEASPSSTYNGSVQIKIALNGACTTELPYTITVDNGDFRVFTGGNYRTERTSVSMIGSIAAKIDIIINGGSFNSAVSYGVYDALKLDTAFSISGMAMLAGDATLTINGGDFNTPIYAQGYLGLTSTTSSAGSRLVVTDPKYYAADGDITITVKGGDFTDCIEISAEQVAASYNRLLRGNFTLNIGEDAILADGIVFDATQVKAYPDENGNTPAGSPVATLTYPAEKNVDAKRFDFVNGTDMTGTFTEPLRIACIGDSITQGSRAYVTDSHGKWEDFGNGSYPAQLYVKAKAAGHDVIISNYGCGATKVMDRGGLWYNAGLAYTLSQEETDANYFIIGLGTNDAACSGNSVGFADAFYDMYTDFIQSYADLPCTDMVYGTTAIYRNGSDVSAVGLTRAMQMQVLTELAAAGEKATLVDLYGLTLDAGLDGRLLWEGDNLHPDVPGYAVYADAIYGAVLAENPKTVPENFYMKELYVASAANGGKKTAKCTLANPTTELSVALAKADPEGATIYIIGAYDYTKLDTNTPFNTPRNIKNLTIAGYGAGAALSVNTKMFYINGDVKFDNIQLSYSNKADSAIYIACGYNNVEFTETFTTTGTGGAVMAAGYLTYGDVFTNNYYTTPESVSTDRDCTVTVNGGSYGYLYGGNVHWPGNTGSVYGTYGGHLTLNVGAGVTIAKTIYGTKEEGGINGMNYLTGKITANIASWNDGIIREYSLIGKTSKERDHYDTTKNTGTVEINLAEGMTNTVVKARDLNKDGTVDFADALVLLKYAIGGYDSNYSSVYYFDQTTFKIKDVLYALRNAVQ